MDVVDKYNVLKDIIKKSGKPIVAFSGGVDSSLLAKAAYDVWGEKMLAVCLDSPTTPHRELESAKKVADEIGFPFEIIPHNELCDEKLVVNPENRCYFCKKNMADHLLEIMGNRGFEVVLEGTSRGDLSGHRPGYQALQEMMVKSPLVDAGFGKEDVRLISKSIGVSNWDMPSTACLSSRIPYGKIITPELLEKIDLAEEFLISLGFRQVRVRTINENAKIEVEPGQIQKCLDESEQIVPELKRLGFKGVSIDLEGYNN